MSRDEAEKAGELSLHIQPIDLVDIGRVLGESAKAERLGDIPVRAWRDDLTVIRDSLSYARAVLAADVAILSESGPSATTEAKQRVVDDLPGTLAAVDPDPEWPDQDVLGPDPDIDEGLFVRTDHLLATHREMARVDLTSRAARARVLELVEQQLAMLTERQAAVEARLQQIRALIFRRYRDAAAPAHDQTA
jgi:chromosome condensin MukBEF ATPase and DNA-binding subunit MukB